MEALGSILTTVVNGGWKLYLTVFVASAALLFLPDSLIVQLGLDEIRHQFRTYIGIALIASASFLAVALLSNLLRIGLQPWRNRQFNRAVYKTLSELTRPEKEFLAEFIFGHANTVSAAINDGVAGGLAAKKIIYRSSQFSAGLEWPYNLQSVPRKLLTAHPELLD